MIDFYLDATKTRIRTLGTAQQIAADMALCVATLFARTKAANPAAAKQLKAAIMAIFGADSPVWTVDVPEASDRDVCSVITVDKSELGRQTQEAQDADA